MEEGTSNIPDELVMQIFIRLPVKSLLRFKSLSKSWYSLFNSPDFITNYFNFQNSNTNNSILTTHLNHISQTLEITSLSDPTLTHISSENLHLPPSVTDIYHSPHSFGVLGPVNGILCIFYEFGVNLILWNPATRESMPLPSFTPSRNWETSFPVLGFGFDSKISNDYKVVRIVSYSSPHEYDPDYSCVEVFTPIEGYWRMLGIQLPSQLMGVSTNTYVNEACHWWAHSSYICSGATILSFHMGNELFGNIPLPAALDDWSTVELGQLAVIDDNLAVCLTSGNDSLEIWVMTLYCVKESWTKLYVVEPHLQVRRPIGFLKNSELLMQDDSGQLLLYDPNSRRLKHIQVHGAPFTMGFVHYTETLFPIKRRNNLG